MNLTENPLLFSIVSSLSAPNSILACLSVPTAHIHTLLGCVSQALLWIMLYCGLWD